jgi:hypothetical protein
MMNANKSCYNTVTRLNRNRNVTILIINVSSMHSEKSKMKAIYGIGSLAIHRGIASHSG